VQAFQFVFGDNARRFKHQPCLTRCLLRQGYRARITCRSGTAGIAAPA
jgi:hypothetical protein